MSDELERTAQKFLDAFECVFHEDWAYTKQQLGTSEPGAANELRRIFAEEPVDEDASETFLCPNEPIEELDYLNWGNYQALLESYAKLCDVMKRPRVQRAGK